MDLDTISGLLRAERIKVVVTGGSPKFIGRPSDRLGQIVRNHRDLIVALGDGELPGAVPWAKCHLCLAFVRHDPADDDGGGGLACACDEFMCPYRRN